MAGYIVTRDVDSRDSPSCAKLRRFVYGYELHNNERVYQYPGFVEREGVRYLGQSVLFVIPDQLSVLRDFLRMNGIDHAVRTASVGSAYTWPPDGLMPS